MADTYPVQGGIERQPFTIQCSVCLLQGLDGIAAESVTFQPFTVEAARPGRISRYQDVRGNILDYHGSYGRKTVCTDTTKLVYAGKPAKDDIILDDHMTGQGGIVGEHDMITDKTVTRNMHIGHDPVAVAQAGYTSAAGRTAIDGTELANGIAIPDLQNRFRLARVFLVLRPR